MQLPWQNKPDRTEEYAVRLNKLDFLKDPNVIRFREKQNEKIEQFIDAALCFSKMPAEQKVGYVQAMRRLAGDIFADEIRELESKIAATSKRGKEQDFYEEVSRIP